MGLVNIFFIRQKLKKKKYGKKYLKKFKNIFFLLQPESFETNSNITQTIRMIEYNWRLHPSGEPVTRGTFMTALQNITYVLIRGTASIAFTSLT